MENIVNEVENLEQEMNLDDVKAEEPEKTEEKKEPEKTENPYEGYRISGKKVFGIAAGITGLITGTILLVRALTTKPTEEGEVEEVAE